MINFFDSSHVIYCVLMCHRTYRMLLVKVNVFLLIFYFAFAQQVRDGPPNIIFILTDDQDQVLNGLVGCTCTLTTMNWPASVIAITTLSVHKVWVRFPWSNLIRVSPTSCRRCDVSWKLCCPGT